MSDEVESPVEGQTLVLRPKGPGRPRRIVSPPPMPKENDSDEDDEEDDTPPPIAAKRETVTQQAVTTAFVPKKPEMIEDLYALFPNIGDGSFRLRVERIQPKVYGGLSIAGVIGDFDEKIPMSEFVTLFGGGKYTVYVIGPMPGRDDVVKVLAALEDINVPGPPAPGSLPGGEDVMMGGPGYGRQQMSDPPNVQIKRIDVEQRQLEAEREERKHLQQKLEERQKAPDQAFEMLREQNSTTVQMLREQNREMMLDFQKKEAELSKLRDELVNERRTSLEATRNAETALERRMEKLHAESMKALTDRHTSEMNALREQRTTETNTLREQHTLAVTQLEARNKERVDRLTDDAKTDRERLERDAKLRVDTLKDTYDARLADLERSTKRELEAVREQRDREVAAMKLTYETSEKFAKQSGEIRVETLAAEIVRLRTEEDKLRRENEAMRKAQNKDPATFIRETREIASSLLGMVDGAEVAAAAAENEKDEPFDWKKEGLKGALNLLSKAPELAREIAGGIQAQRAQNQQMVAQQQQQQQQQQAQGGGGNRALPAGRRKNVVAPNAWTGGNYTPVADEIPFSPPIPPRIYVQQAAEPQAQQPHPPAPALVQQPQTHAYIAPGSLVPGQPMPPAAPAPMPAAPAAPAQTAPATGPQGQEPSLDDTEKALLTVMDELEKAIAGDVVPPPLFAQMIVQNAGPAWTAYFLQKFTADTFLGIVQRQVEAAEKRGVVATSVILTRDGKTYVKAVWSETANLIAQIQQQAQAQQAQPTQ